ncbi:MULTISPECIES: VOC family protein [unclassified Mesorhizobium]|uniref:VOC family protein n=1 Tax=unclassified Mesorhizobium TaxID=325217 RepID=UPI00301538BC
MSNTFMLLYVTDAEKSARFYQDLLGREPQRSSPGFITLTLENGFTIALWAKNGAVPAADFTGSSTELVFTVDGASRLDVTHADWAGRGLKIVMEPTDLHFGRNFVALDPDGHRIRVVAPN